MLEKYVKLLILLLEPTSALVVLHKPDLQIFWPVPCFIHLFDFQNYTIKRGSFVICHVRWKLAIEI